MDDVSGTPGAARAESTLQCYRKHLLICGQHDMQRSRLKLLPEVLAIQLTYPGVPGAGTSPADILEHILDHVLEHLKEVSHLRLTSRVFRYHPAVMKCCHEASLPSNVTMLQLQLGFPFLQKLPNMKILHLDSPKTLFGVHTLSQLKRMEVHNCQHLALDMTLLSLLPRLQELEMQDCRAQQLLNLSELKHLTLLSIGEHNVDPDIASLKGLQKLDIYPDNSTQDMKAHGVVYQGLKGLTSLTDNARGAPVWSSLPSLVCIDVFSRFDTLIGVSFPASLRVLCLYNDRLVADSPLYLGPLTSISCLERLKIVGRSSGVPRLEMLKFLVLEFQGAHSNCFPQLAGLPRLQEIHLSLSSDLVLPHLAGISSLRRIYYKRNSHILTMDIRNNGRFVCTPVIHLGSLGQGL